ncbi:MAG: RHS repeat-associated core domain-containing protein, partial [Candidatus Omnitrophica bacterium]|nr:RHS repeat-associated core domain-containing protein [Candidatus Omnitrophota bacterium]
ATYDSFGNVQITKEQIVNNLRFPGQYFDAETGLYYNYNRYYDPTTGRYLRTDPFCEGLNLYAYCFNNPNYWIDPWGLCAISAAPYAIAGSINPALPASILASAQAAALLAEAGIVVLQGAVVAAVGVAAYMGTSALIEDTWLEHGIGEAAYDWTHDDNNATPYLEAKSKKGKVPKNVDLKGHETNTEASNLPKHQSGEKRKGQKFTDKKRQNKKRGKKWKPRK